MQGTFSTILSFTEPGDGIVLQLPAYPPFHDAINSTGRRLLPYRLHSGPAGWKHEPGALEKLIDPTTKMFLLCNPQNPTGRVFDHAELAEIGRIAIERDLIILSDEIHADLIYGGHKHIPIATISPEIAARTITIPIPCPPAAQAAIAPSHRPKQPPPREPPHPRRPHRPGPRSLPP